jgi:hypothetical protein
MQTTSLFLASASVQSALSLLTAGALENSSERALQALEAIRESGNLSDPDGLNVIRELISQGSLQEARICLGLFAAQLSERRLSELSEAATAVLGVKRAHRVIVDYRREPRLVLQDYERFPVLVERIGENPPVADALTAGNYLLTGTSTTAVFLYENTRDDSSAPKALHQIRFEGGAYFLDGRPLSHKQEVEAAGRRYRIRLPEGFVLEKLAEEIALQTKNTVLAALLRAHGLASRADEVEALLKSSTRLDDLLKQIENDIPVAGGLREKMRELAILNAFQSLKTKYFPATKDCEALSQSFEIANEVALAESPEAIVALLSRASSPWILLMLSPIRDHAKGYLPPSAVPEAFGIRERISDLNLPPPPRLKEDPFVLKILKMNPQEFAERPWQHIEISKKLRVELEPYRRFVAQKLDLEGLLLQARRDEDDGDDAFDLAPGHTVKAMYNRYEAKAADSTRTPSGGPGATDRLLRDLRQATIAGYANGYWMYGGDAPQRRFEARIYLSLNRRFAFAIWSYLNRVLGEELRESGVTTQFKMAVRREGLRRSDSSVVYFLAEGQREIYDSVAGMSAQHPEFFKEGRPIFTAPLIGPDGNILKGVSFGEHPRFRGQSFGSLRTSALGTGIDLARLILAAGRSPDWEEFLQIFALCLDRHDVDIQDPAFNKGGGGNLAFLKSKMQI